ncbi:hypothetical protein L218DRAFT_640526 [Marasmius fiardii PR-910]|nr:hypothetical protein L218DRAFT_640526 [Marasmius fiardii PR-910]
MILACIMLLQQTPSQWPPIFDSPLKATSVTNFWSKRWHQIFRHSFVSLGAALFCPFGRAGKVMGAFFVSGALHYLGTWGMGNASDWGIGFRYHLGEFVEEIIRSKSCWGFWIWTFIRTIGWGIVIVDAWARKGLLGARLYFEGYRPAECIYKPLSNGSC